MYCQLTLYLHLIGTLEHNSIRANQVELRPLTCLKAQATKRHNGKKNLIVLHHEMKRKGSEKILSKTIFLSFENKKKKFNSGKKRFHFKRAFVCIWGCLRQTKSSNEWWQAQLQQQRFLSKSNTTAAPPRNKTKGGNNSSKAEN